MLSVMWKKTVTIVGISVWWPYAVVYPCCSVSPPSLFALFYVSSVFQCSLMLKSIQGSPLSSFIISLMNKFQCIKFVLTFQPPGLDTFIQHAWIEWWLIWDLSLADTIEKEMRKLFSIPDEKETRLWNKYMSNTFEPLNKPDSTIQDAGLYQGQVGQ